MIKKFTMYIPLDSDTELVPVTYEFVTSLEADWLCYKNIATNHPYYTTQRCMEEFIQKGYIYDIEY